MARERVLIVEPDPVVGDRLRQLLTAEGYTVSLCQDLVSASNLLSSSKFELVVVEPHLPGASQLSALREIHSRVAEARVPVLVLTEDFDPRTRIEALRLGAADYLTKPYDREELRLKIRNWLHLVQRPQAPEGGQAGAPWVLEWLKREDISELVPEPDVTSRYGFSIARLAKVLQLEEPGQELDFLDQLAANGHLEREFYDVVYLCPVCGHPNLSFREVCPGCGSANLRTQKLYRHGCGHTGLRSDFLADRCPRCSRPVDLDELEKAGARYVCVECGKAFPEPGVNCRCLRCGRFLDVGALERRTIWKYRLPGDGNGATRSEVVRQRAGPSQLAALVDPELAQRFLDPQTIIAHIQRLFGKLGPGQSATVLQVRLHDLRRLREIAGEERARRIVSGILRRVLGALSAEEAGFYGTDAIVAVLPGLSPPQARRKALEIRSDLERTIGPIPLSIRLAGFPQDGHTVDEILEMLEAGIDDVSFAGT
ncbi:MAG: response regulator [candidate division KSB1 bacterium]|nr:response regulator [candidate division KSB1 bacterium]